MDREPERERIDQLLDRVSSGEISEAETEELALYVDSYPALQDDVKRRASDANLGRGWLARLEADRKIAAVETSRRTRVEQGVGLAVAGVGVAVQIVNPLLGVALCVAGVALLIVSILRVRLATHKHDPYKDVQR